MLADSCTPARPDRSAHTGFHLALSRFFQPWITPVFYGFPQILRNFFSPQPFSTLGQPEGNLAIATLLLSEDIQHDRTGSFPSRQ